MMKVTASTHGQLMAIRHARAVEKMNKGGYGLRYITKSGALSTRLHARYDGRTEFTQEEVNKEREHMMKNNPGKDWAVVSL